MLSFEGEILKKPHCIYELICCRGVIQSCFCLEMIGVFASEEKASERWKCTFCSFRTEEIRAGVQGLPEVAMLVKYPLSRLRLQSGCTAGLLSKPLI